MSIYTDWKLSLSFLPLTHLPSVFGCFIFTSFYLFFFILRRGRKREGGCFYLCSGTKFCDNRIEGKQSKSSAPSPLPFWFETVLLFWRAFPTTLSYRTLIQFAGWFWYARIEFILKKTTLEAQMHAKYTLVSKRDTKNLNQSFDLLQTAYTVGHLSKETNCICSGDIYPRKQTIRSLKLHIV